MSATETLNQVQELVEKVSEDYPNLTKPFLLFLRKVEEGGALSTKIKEIISVALSVALKCKWCIAFHVKNALEAGATRDELIEASYVAVLMAGGPALMYTQLVIQAIDDFQEQLATIK
ncbi:MAG: carboxymuconolactone decarboxylase family protein [Candidatus Jordarchaeum sp.]|uniref:carboxymuconolactone decarboxylase family protein n=1 Tax=Candidatus Jordarchaeum sp. TaxID=2823881 RepID=UPI0040497FD1